MLIKWQYILVKNIKILPVLINSFQLQYFALNIINIYL